MKQPEHQTQDMKGIEMIGQHFGPPLEGWASKQAEHARAMGFRTVGESALLNAQAAGWDPENLDLAPPEAFEIRRCTFVSELVDP